MMKDYVKRMARAVLDRRHRTIEQSVARDISSILGKASVGMLDVGASGGILPRWQPFKRDISFIGIEPDPRSMQDLLDSPEASEYRGYRILPVGAWSRDGKIDISFTRKPMCSSHFQPNAKFLAQFPDAARFEVVSAGAVDCKTLDSLLSDQDSVDFIKLDLEGGELEVLTGATRLLTTCLGLHVEVSFQALREGQPLFGDVAGFLQRAGIAFVDFVTIIRWERDSFRGAGQAVVADALFLRMPEDVAQAITAGLLEANKAKPYLAILLVYERFDLARRFLSLLGHSRGIMDDEYVRVAIEIIDRRKKLFDSRFEFSRRLGGVAAHLGAPQSRYHYLY